MGETMTVEIEYADGRDLGYLQRHDELVPPDTTRDKIARREVIVVRVDGSSIGWLRFGYLWDTVPFMNLLFVEEGRRSQGYGSRMIGFWESEMRARGCDLVMTSSQADERAQHLYRRLGYRDCGSLLFPGQIPLEVVFVKSLN